MTAASATKTPGYNVRLGIYFSADKNGKRRAYRWSPGQFRAFPIGLDKAEAFIAQGQADLLDRHPITGRCTRPAGAPDPGARHTRKATMTTTAADVRSAARRAKRATERATDAAELLHVAIVYAYESGVPVAHIADAAALTRARIYQILSAQASGPDPAGTVSAPR